MDYTMCVSSKDALSFRYVAHIFNIPTSLTWILLKEFLCGKLIWNIPLIEALVLS